MEAITTLFTNLLNIGLGVAVIVGAFFFMGGGYIYMTAQGNPRQMEKGKTAMVNSLAGLALVVSAKLVAQMIATALGH